MTHTGHCLCGAVRFAYQGDGTWSGHCHCESCRRQTGSAFTSFVGVTDGDWAWTGAAPATYVSSPGVRRRFCATCGAPVAFEADKYPGMIHFFAALLDDPAVFKPESHVNSAERLPWIVLADGLPHE